MTFSDRIRKAVQVIREAPAVLIGAGTGLRTSSGEGPGQDGHFAERYGDFADRYGITDVRTAASYPFPTPEEYWAWWSRAVLCSRYEAEPAQPYRELLQLVHGKEYFVITTNVDGQFQKAGFAQDRIFAAQGDLGRFQCATPCTRSRTYGNEEAVREMSAHQRDMRVPTELVPVCPDCGGPLTINLRMNDRFVEDAAWEQAAEAYTRFIRHHRHAPVAFVEIGVGYGEPRIIKDAFWQMVDANPNAHYILINRRDVRFPKEIAERTVLIQQDAGKALEEMSEYSEEIMHGKATSGSEAIS